ncbi:hypothetical protein, partial [Actinomadura sp. RB99]|uniref:hypothetical protein n=1 Tax=Actinomadura sp. RB99 TaxID=2691577 RepID=UPI0019D5CC5D
MGSTHAERRLWRTADDRLVGDGDPDGLHLAYAPGDAIAAADQAKVPDRGREQLLGDLLLDVGELAAQLLDGDVLHQPAALVRPGA